MAINQAAQKYLEVAKREPLYGRMGFRSDLDKILATSKAGLDKEGIKYWLKEDKDAQTVLFGIGVDVLISAICKDGRVWIIMCNEEYFPKPALPVKPI